MNTYRIAICDDESLTCQEIKDILVNNSHQIGVNFDTEIFYTGESLIENIRCGAAYDFLILDIEISREFTRGPHSFRRNGITRICNASGGNIYLASVLYGNSPQSASRHYYTGIDLSEAKALLEGNNLRVTLAGSTQPLQGRVTKGNQKSG